MKYKAYEKLAIDTAYNLGGDNINDLNDAMRWLNINALESSEEGVVEEVNFLMQSIQILSDAADEYARQVMADFEDDFDEPIYGTILNIIADAYVAGAKGTQEM